MKKIEAVQGLGYGKYEFDLLNEDGYCGLLIGTETRNGIIWEIQEWRNGNMGAILRVPAMTMEAVMSEVQSFLGR